jgi:hypothetical protein
MGANGVTGENRTLVGWFTASRLNHSATATSGGSRENRTLITGLQDQGSPIELPTRTLLTQTWSERGESNSVPLAGGQKPNQSATPAIFGAESGSPTRLCSLEDCHLRRSVNPAYGSARQNRTGLAALPKQFIANNDWAEQNGSGSENRTRVAALRVQCSAA